jgi:hypothetical protein
MVAVVIGVDPHKGSHTAVAISPAEEPLGELSVRAPGDHRAGARAGQAPRSRAARFSALITARSDAFTIDSLMPTPHSTRSPTSISR